MPVSPIPIDQQTLPDGVRSGYHWLYFLIFSLMLCGLTLMTLKTSYDSHLSKAQYQNTLTTSAGAEILNRMLENIDILFPGIDELITRLPQTDSSYDLQLADVLLARKRENAQLMDLLVTDSKGRITHWTGRGTPPSITDRAYVRAHLDNIAHNDRFIGRPQLSKVHKDQWFFAVSRAIRDERGELQRILVAILDIAYLHSALMDIERTEQGTFMVGSRDGKLYSRVPDHDKMVGRDVPILRRLSSQTQDSFTMTFLSPLDNVERIVSLRQTREPDLLFISSLAVDEVLAPWYEEVKAILLGLIAALILVGGLTLRLHRGHRKLLHLSTYDDLSRLLNRSTFMRLAQRELAQVRRYPAPLSAILVDLDDFKKVNDQHGHLMGDNYIRAMGQLLSAHTRDCDLSCRYGGEEFLLLLPRTGIEGAWELADKLRTQINRLALLPKDSPLKTSGSFGVAQLLPNESLESLFRRADQAMYRAKNDGKNRIESDLSEPERTAAAL